MNPHASSKTPTNFNAGGAEDKLLLGIALIASGEMCFVIMGAIIRQASADIPLVQIMFFRNFFALFFVGYFVYKLGFHTLKTRRHKTHLLRAVVGLSAMFFMVYSFSQLKLTEATLLKSVSPVLIPFMAWIILREKLGWLTWAAIALAFVGVIIIIKPQGVNLSANLGVAAGLLAACLAGVAKIVVRKLGTTEPSAVIVFYFALYGSVLTAPLCFLVWTPMNTTLWLLLALCAFMASGGQLCVTRAYTVAKAGKISMFSYLSMPIAGALGWLIWSESIGLSLILGSLFIVCAGYLNFREHQTKLSKT